MNPDEKKDEATRTYSQLRARLTHAEERYLHWSTLSRAYNRTPDSKEWYAHLAAKNLAEEAERHGAEVVNISQCLKRHQIK